MSAKPWVVLVGGFLGSGKTTLILAAARELQQRGLRSAMVWNDQGEDLVDSQYAALSGMHSGEVTGGCFCCRLSELIDAIGDLRAHAPDVIFAEPVGSCTDLSATVLRPLLEYSETYQLSPLTVLVDPLRARSMLSRGRRSRTCVSCSISNCRKPIWSVLPSRISTRNIRRSAPLMFAS